MLSIYLCSSSVFFLAMKLTPFFRRLRKDTDFALRDVPLSDIWTLSGCGRANAKYIYIYTYRRLIYIYIYMGCLWLMAYYKWLIYRWLICIYIYVNIYGIL